MPSNNIPKKYQLVLQKIYGGQDAIEFSNEGEISVVPIKVFSDKKLKATSKKDTTVQKNTLSFYDAITNKFANLESFLKSLGNIMAFNYKINTSYIGFLNNGYMNKLEISFNDSVLAHIALVADGNNINKDDKTTMDILTDIIEMIEDEKSDFVSVLQQSQQSSNSHYNLSRNFIESINTYHTIKQTLDAKCRNGYRINDELIQDLNVFKKDFLNKVQSYKSFRELYRFRKEYLYNKQISEYITLDNNHQVLKKEAKEETFEEFTESFKEIQEKNYPKKKVKSKDLPGQISLLDLLD